MVNGNIIMLIPIIMNLVNNSFYEIILHIHIRMVCGPTMEIDIYTLMLLYRRVLIIN